MPLRAKFSVYIPLLFILIYLLPLGMRNLWAPDEFRYAEMAREMVQTGDWVVPKFNDVRYFEKPIMGHWVNAISQILFGHNNFAARAPVALSALGTAWFLFLLVSRAFSRRQAWLTTGMYLSFFLVIGINTYDVLDGQLNFWLTAVFTTFYFASEAKTVRQRYLYYGLAGATCAGAFLTKGFLALALPVLVVLPYMVWRKKTIEIMRWGLWVMAVTLVLCLPWCIAIYRAEPDFWHYFFWIEHIKRFSSPHAQHAAPFWYYIPIMILATLPWLFLVPSAIKHLSGQWQQPLLRYALLWCVLPFIFFSIARGKLPTYILPCMAPLAILLTAGLTKAFNHRAKGLKWGTMANMLVFIVLTIVFLVLHSQGKLNFESTENYRVWLWVVALGGWAALAGVALKVKTADAKMLSYMAMPAPLFMLIWALIPNQVAAGKMPADFIQAIKPQITANTVLIADYPSTMSPLNWYLRRTDVYLTSSYGELKYGLSYADTRHRFIPLDKLNAFITKERQHAPVMVFLRELKKLPDNIQAPQRTRTNGRFTALFYDQLPAQ